MNANHPRRAMALSWLTIICLLLGACTSARTVDMPPAELHAAIRSGDLVTPGERIRVATADGETHTFEVERIDDTAIHGAAITVPIDDIVAVGTRGLDAGRTALLAGGAIGLGFLIGVLIGPALILAAASP